MIHVIATIELQPDTRLLFLAEFHNIIPAVRAEEGCIEYGAAIDLETGMSMQGAVRPNVVVVVEKWANLDALTAHARAPHMVAYRPRVKDYVIRTTLQILEPA